MLSRFSGNEDELSKSRAVLELLVREYFISGGPVDGQDFRADNYELVEILDRLTGSPFVRQDSHGRYQPGLAALREVKSPEAKRLLNDAEKIFKSLREQYSDRAKRKSQRKLPDLARELDIELDQVFRCFDFLGHETWAWAAGSLIDRREPDRSYVQPGERILKYQSLGDIFGDLAEHVEAATQQRPVVLQKKSKPDALRTSLDSYSLGLKIGEGGCATVFEAIAESTGEAVAIKILKREAANTQRLKRFRNELMFCMTAHHPNIISVLDHGVTENSVEGLPFFVMPRATRTLRHLISTAILPVEALALFFDVLSGVNAAHRRGVIHRDLKPENILRNQNGSFLVADFGIAHFAQEDLYTVVETRLTERLANYKYAAPEQKERRAEVGVAADIYALGLILNELFTGEVPQGTNFASIGEKAPEYSWLDPVVDQMIRQKPSDRIQSVEEVRHQIEIRGQQKIADSRLRELSATRMGEANEDDHFITDPIRLVGFDYSAGTLILKLNKNPSPQWIAAFQRIGNYSHFMGGLGGPLSYRFMGAEARIAIEPRHAQQIVDWFKDLLLKASGEYRAKMNSVRKRTEQDRRQRLQQQIDEEQRRAEVLGKLRI